MIGILFLGNSKLNKIENVKQGNPGIGGTEYLVLQLFYYLNCTRKDVFLITNDQNLKGRNILYFEHSVMEQLTKQTIKTLILIPKNLTSEFYSELNKKGISCIAWVHNYISYSVINELSKNDCIKKVVFVGKQHYDCYIDDELCG